MKKTLCVGLAIIMLLSAFSITALADNPEHDGIYDVTKSDNVTITFYDENNNVIKAANTQIDDKNTELYADAVKMELEISGATDQYELIIAQSEEGAPTADNIVYIDQTSPKDEKVTFMVYPSKLEGGKDYYIYLSTNAEGRKVIVSFKYYVSRMLGDVNGDGDINGKDALACLKHSVQLEILTGIDLKVADVNHDNEVNGKDALAILKHSVGLELIG